MSFTIGAQAQELVRKLSSQNPPESPSSSGEAVSGTPADAGASEVSGAALEAPAPQGSNAAPQPRKKMNFKSVDAYSLRLDGGFGWRNFQNGQKLDHDGGMFRLAAGLHVPVGKRLTISPRLAYEYQGLKKPLGFNIESQAKAHMVGLELDLGIAVHPKWFSIHPVLGIGAAIYRAPGNREGTVGAEFNKNPQLFPMKETGARIELGLQLCTWGDAICLGAKFAGDMGVNPALEVIDGPEGGNPAMGLNPLGASVSGGVDMLRIVSNLMNRRKPKERDVVENSDPVSVDPYVSPDSPPSEEASFVPAEDGADGLPPTLPNFTVADFEERLKEVRMQHTHVAGNLKIAKGGLEQIKDPKVKKSDKRINADSAIAFFRNSRERTQSVEVVIAGLSDAYGKMEAKDPAEDARAFEILQEALGLYKEMAANTVEGHGVAQESVNFFNKRRGSLEVLEFSDPKPEYQVLQQ